MDGGDPTFENDQQNFVQQNLRELLDSHLPSQISRFEESSVNLERVAAFCEANYLQSADKANSLAETKRFALQGMASFAFLVGELSRSLLNALELEAVNLSEKTSQIRSIEQLVAIQKEKTARREIGKLTANKNVIRLNKITYPSSEERTPRYQRTPIDFSILDGIGHGKRIALPPNDYGTIRVDHRQGTYNQFLLSRTGSMLSSGGAATNVAVQNHQQQPIYDHYAKANYGTLSRGSSVLPPSAVAAHHDQYRVPVPVAALHDQYRVPLPIPSTVPSQQQFVRSVQYSQHFPAQQYALSSHPQMSRDEIMDNVITGSTQYNGRYHQKNHHANGNNSAQNTAAEEQSQLYELRGNRVAMTPQVQQHAAHLDNELQQHQQQVDSNNSGGRMNSSADFSDDGLPLPPPLLLSNAVATDQPTNRFTQHQPDDGFPPPPPLNPLGLNSAVGELPNWVPAHYIEKSVVLFEYNSKNSDELHLYRGAFVYVLRKNEDGWFEGVLDGITGLFPGNYVKPIQQ